MDRFDIVIIGTGVIGLAIGKAIAETFPARARQLVLLDQEASFGQHTSSRNSEVIHAGLYYSPDSLKARLCLRGKQLLYEHCRRYQLPYRQTGKLIVSTAAQANELEQLQVNATASGVSDLNLIDKKDLHRLEPEVFSDSALYSPSSGIIDSHRYMESLLHLAQDKGAIFAPRTRFESAMASSDGFKVSCISDAAGKSRSTETYVFNTRHLINCGGLRATEIARQIEPFPREIPEQFLCKGSYFDYTGPSPFSHLVYPLPEKHQAGLGIHATLDLSGRLRFGPDTEYIESVDYSIDAEKRNAFAQAIARYFPAIESHRLTPAYAGVRPKLTGPGKGPADFVIQGEDQHGVPRLIQLFGIESPGLTASLALAEKVVELIGAENQS